MNRKKLLLGTAVAAGIPAGLLAGGTAFFFCYSVMRLPEKKRKGGYDKYDSERREGIAWFRAQKPEQVILTSEDGLKLSAYFLPAPCESKKVLLLMHGYRSEELVDFSGLFRFYHEQGYHLLVPCQRSHGQSEGRYICFGVKERFDCKMWAEYAVRRLGADCELFLSGISMGCATVLMAAGLELPENVRGIIADCGYTSPKDIFSHVFKMKFGLPEFPLMRLTELVTRKIAGFGYTDASTLEVLKTCKIPILFIHGGKDDFVPVQMTLDNYQACSAPRELLIIPEAGHAVSSLADPARYREAVMRFIKDVEEGKLH